MTNFNFFNIKKPASCELCGHISNELKWGLVPLNDKPFCPDEIEGWVCVDEKSCKEEYDRNLAAHHAELDRWSKEQQLEWLKK